MIEAIVFLPLLAALFVLAFGKLVGPTASMVVTTTLLFAAAILAIVALFTWGFGSAETERITIAEWIISGDLDVAWQLRVDALTVVMLALITTVSALIHVYAIGYLRADERRATFSGYVALLVFAALVMVTSNNLVQLLFAWQGMAIAGYLLVGFRADRPAPNAAATKTFVMNRVGDVALLLGAFTLFAMSGTLNFDGLFGAAPAMANVPFVFWGADVAGLELACLLLVAGAMAKSAQFLLHPWLAEAAEGPPPMSALIQSVTLVAAGVFLVARLSPLFEFAPTALAFLTIVGAVTAFFAATVACVKNEMDRVMANSTSSQVGFMLVAAGMGAYPVALFHLCTHAFFKGLMVLSAGAVKGSMDGEQDLRRMGGLRKKLPFTYSAMLVGVIALTGFPPAAGYFSGHLVVESAFAGVRGGAAFASILLIVSVALTGVYGWRMLFMAFHGKTRAPADTYKHAEEPPLTMLVAMGALAVGALIGGILFMGAFMGETTGSFWKGALYATSGSTAPVPAGEGPLWVTVCFILAVFAGFAISFTCYIARPDFPKRLIERFPGMHTFLSRKWFVDEAYALVMVRPARALGEALWSGDRTIAQGVGPFGLTGRIRALAAATARLHTGNLYHYSIATMVGFLVLVTLVVALNRGVS
ncbi:MAG: NADH-quinone oxidoreductase subunit L [Pseudomonadota bacterium]